MTRIARFANAVWRLVCGFAAILGFLLILVTFTPVLRYYVSALSTPWGPQDGDTLIVLGQDTTQPDMLGIGSYWRSFYAVLVWRESHFHRVIVTGRGAAPLMRDLMVNQGVPRDAIVVEDSATSTRENAQYVARLLNRNPGRCVLLTSDYHMRRALGVFRKAGVTASPLPFPDANKRLNDRAERWTVFLALLTETAKTAYYRMHGWI